MNGRLGLSREKRGKGVENVTLPNCPAPDISLLTEDLFNNFPESNLYDSPIDQPPSSAFPSETSSALVSESDLPPPSSTKPTKQKGMLDFFSKIPVEEAQARW